MSRKSIDIEVVCSVCGKKELKKPSRAKGYKTCSMGCFSIFTTGHKPYHWKGGRLVHKGYVYILKKGHPSGDRDGYVPEHRLKMEIKIGRFLTKTEVVNHKNGKRSDNRIENLELLSSQSEHMSRRSEERR